MTRTPRLRSRSTYRIDVEVTTTSEGVEAAAVTDMGRLTAHAATESCAVYRLLARLKMSRHEARVTRTN